jgi:hypothetical protein
LRFVLADRVDRREVEHVEAQVAHIGQPRDHVVEGAVGHAFAHRAGEKFVPGAEDGALAVDPGSSRG